MFHCFSTPVTLQKPACPLPPLACPGYLQVKVLVIALCQCARAEKTVAPRSSALAWKIPWMEEPGGLQSMGSLRVGHDWAASLSLFTFMNWRRKWQPTPVFLPGESQGRRSLVGCRLWGCTESDTTEATWQQQQQCTRDGWCSIYPQWWMPLCQSAKSWLNSRSFPLNLILRSASHTLLS